MCYINPLYVELFTMTRNILYIGLIYYISKKVQTNMLQLSAKLSKVND